MGQKAAAAKGWRDADALRRVAVLLCTVITCTLLTVDVDGTPGERVEVGEIARKTVRAPFAFQWIDAEALDARRDAAGDRAMPVFLYDEAWLTAATARLRGAFHAAQRAAAGEGTEATGGVEPALALLQTAGVALPPERLAGLAEAGFPDAAATRVASWLGEAYGDRLVPTDRAELPSVGAVRVVPRVGDRDAFVMSGRERVASVEEVRRAVEVAALRQPGDDPWSEDAVALAVALVQPNLYFDVDRTAAERQAASDAVPDAPVLVKRGEILFREGDPLTPQDVARHEAMRAANAGRGLFGSWTVVAGWLFVALAGLVAGARPYFRTPAASGGAGDETRNLAAGGLLLVGLAGLGRVLSWMAEPLASSMGDAPPDVVWYLLPTAGATMVVRLLMGPARAVVFAIGAAIVLTPLTRLDALVVIYTLLTSLVGAAASAHMRERIAVLRAGLLAGGFGAGLVSWAMLVQAWATEGVGAVSLPLAAPLLALGGGLLSGIVVLAVVPLFEVLGFTTDYRLLELASLNHPVMRQLLLRAPGTYHHSIIVGSLAEAACEAIGANALEAKVSAYFHDIGKAVKPAYFVENQRGGANRHNDLDPTASARIIIDHVHHGVRMAKEHGLPKPLLDNIRMHHGTGLLQYFYAKAQAQAPDPDAVSEAEFRYPGPKPNNREAGVVMLADKVEAATRTIKEPTEANVRAMINRIINSVMADDQFSECPLTFREIYVIADVFTRVLMGIYHQRIEYPQTASLSSAGAAALRAPRPSLPDPNVVTLELEGAGLRVMDPIERDELTDEITDYESVRNLPHHDVD